MTCDRLERLEAAVAHAEAAIEDLSDVIRGQSAEIAALEAEVLRLSRSLETALSDVPDAGAPPPHY